MGCVCVCVIEMFVQIRSAVIIFNPKKVETK